MAGQPQPRVLVQAEDFDLAAEARRVSDIAGVGAIVTFSGICRDESGRLSALEIEHYPGMSERQIRRVADQALSRWPLQAVTAIHRHGIIRPGEQIVLVATAAAHRRAAFEAADFLMDYLKSEAPFWKREHLADGTTGAWVEAQLSDEESKTRWKT